MKRTRRGTVVDLCRHHDLGSVRTVYSLRRFPIKTEFLRGRRTDFKRLVIDVRHQEDGLDGSERGNVPVGK